MTDTVALYARVSTDEQAEKQTIHTQLEYAARPPRSSRAGAWSSSSTTASPARRSARRSVPGGAELIAAARRGEFAKVVTYRLDRLGRRARFIHEAIEDLTALGVAYQSLTEPFDTSTPAG